MEMGGVVLIDRGDAKSAISSMKPLIDAMRKEGKSVVLAPEGTRSISPKLNAFKKGAFHLAMQANVPIIPIVIHNAGDMAPKGDFVFRPATVEVEVLAPIDTSDWRVETINDHVRDVRNLFLKTLGQPVDQGPATKTKTKTKAKPTAKAKPQAKTKPKAAPKSAVKPKLTAKRKYPVGSKVKPKIKPKPKAATRTRSKASPKPKTTATDKGKKA
jgi:putative phosphoserine phosphatase/1-acylglycerol-3-phosphate O-acyltransferase